MLQTLRKWAKPKYPWKIWAIPFLLISPAAFLIPNDVFTQYPWASTLTDWVAAVVPMIDRTAHLHPHPDKFRAFYAYAWCWLPLLLWLVWLETTERAKTTGGIEKMANTMTAFFGMLMGLGILHLLYVAPGDGGWNLTLMTRSDPRARYYSSDFYLVWCAPLVIYAMALFSVIEFKYWRAVWPILKNPERYTTANKHEDAKD